MKLQFWKRFTTLHALIEPYILLCLITWNYNFESDSQLSECFYYCICSCVSSHEITILKAIHNIKLGFKIWNLAVSHHMKLQFWKRFTTKANIIKKAVVAVSHHMKLQFWKRFTTIICTTTAESSCVSSHEITILKAIHNAQLNINEVKEAVSHHMKLQFWKRFTTNFP